jgi:alanine-glyoxylate transaminase/serine-glyoxylate transaminase/serine-pyruvate transaminase
MDDEVLSALGSQAVPHYGPAWAAQYHETAANLRALFRTGGDVYTLVGSGSTGLDAAVGSMLAPGQRLALVRNGYFGNHLHAIAVANGIEVLSIEAPWGRAVRPEDVRAALDAAEPVHALALVHAETSTGALNPARAIAAIGKERGLPVIVDAITALGGTELRVDEWGIDICVSAPQKALAAPAGMGLVAVARSGWEYMDSHPVGPRGWYQDLRTWRTYAAQSPDFHPQLATVPTGTFAALALQTRRILAQGVDAYIERHARASRRFRAGAAAAGIELLVPEAEATPQVSAVVVPQGVDSNVALAALREEHGFLAGGGLGELRGRIIRIGHMGKGASDEYVDAALVALTDVLSA